MSEDVPNFLTVPEVADWLRHSERWVRGQEGLYSLFILLGGKRVISREDFMRYLGSITSDVPIAPALDSPPPEEDEKKNGTI